MFLCLMIIYGMVNFDLKNYDITVNYKMYLYEEDFFLSHENLKKKLLYTPNSVVNLRKASTGKIICVRRHIKKTAFQKPHKFSEIVVEIDDMLHPNLNVNVSRDVLYVENWEMEYVIIWYYCNGEMTAK